MAYEGYRKLRFKSPSAGVKVKLEGNWMGANRLLTSLSPDITAAYLAAQHKIAKRLQRIVKGHIRNQDLGWTSLSEGTISRKGHDKVYMDSGTYYANIKIITRGTRIYVGLPKGLHDDRGRAYGDIASMLEYGTPRIPARPLWGPSYREIDRKYVKKVFAMQLTKIILMRHGVRPQIRV